MSQIPNSGQSTSQHPNQNQQRIFANDNNGLSPVDNSASTAPYVNPQAGSLNVSPMNPPNMVESPENQGISPAGSVSNTNNQNVVTIQSFQNMT